MTSKTTSAIERLLAMREELDSIIADLRVGEVPGAPRKVQRKKAVEKEALEEAKAAGSAAAAAIAAEGTEVPRVAAEGTEEKPKRKGWSEEAKARAAEKRAAKKVEKAKALVVPPPAAAAQPAAAADTISELVKEVDAVLAEEKPKKSKVKRAASAAATAIAGGAADVPDIEEVPPAPKKKVEPRCRICSVGINGSADHRRCYFFGIGEDMWESSDGWVKDCEKYAEECGF